MADSMIGGVSDNCHNPSLGFVTKARACKSAGRKGKLGSARECERMNNHTPKSAPTLGVEAPMDSRIFIKQL